jgi:hypothetical protein
MRACCADRRLHHVILSEQMQATEPIGLSEGPMTGRSGRQLEQARERSCYGNLAESVRADAVRPVQAVGSAPT